MKASTYKLLVTVLSLVILIGGSVLLYRNLGDKIDPDRLGQTTPAEAAPDFTVTDAQGNAVRLSDFRGQSAIVNFWASWCGPCQMEMPHFQAAYEAYGEEVAFLMVNLAEGFGDTRAKAEEMLTQGGYTFPVYYDTASECAITYGINAIPVTLFVDSEGKLVSSKSGMLSEADLERRILAILD